jgi:hypothetical protein
MKQYLHEILYLLGEDRARLPWMAVLFLSLSVLDLAGCGLIAPYVSLTQTKLSSEYPERFSRWLSGIRGQLAGGHRAAGESGVDEFAETGAW